MNNTLVNKEELVIKVFELRNKGLTLQAIGDELWCNRETIRLILNGKQTSARIAIKKFGLSVNPVNLCLNHSCFNKKQVIDIIQLIESGATTDELANKYKVSHVTITRLFKDPKLDPLFKELNVDAKKMGTKLKSNAKRFSAEDIKYIFELYKTKNQYEIAEMLNAKQNHISYILQGRLYKEEIEEMGLNKKNKIIKTHNNRKFSENDIIKIFELRNSGSTYQKIAKEFRTNPSTIGCILNGHLYTDVIKKHSLQYVKQNIS